MTNCAYPDQFTSSECFFFFFCGKIRKIFIFFSWKKLLISSYVYSYWYTDKLKYTLLEFHDGQAIMEL